MPVRLPAADLPVLHACDVFVLGCGFAGMAAALRLARPGRTVAIVEPRTYPGREMTAPGTLFLTASAWRAGDLPYPLSVAFDAAKEKKRRGVWALHGDALKQALEDELRRANVKIYYASLPAGLVQAADGGVAGVILGNKSGRQVIRCAYAVDASETALLARLLGERFETPPARSRYRRWLEFTGVAELAAPAVPLRLPGLARGTLPAFPGLGGAGHYYLEYETVLARHADSALEAARRDREARLLGLQIVEVLKNEHPAFRDALWAGSSHEMAGPFTTPLAVARPCAGLPDCVLPTPDGRAQTMAGACFAVTAPRVLMANEAARASDALRAWWRSPVGACTLGAGVADLVAVPAAPPAPAAAARPEAAGKLRFLAPAQPQRGVAYDRMPVAGAEIAVCTEHDVAVIGGGTSGGIAGIVAGQLGQRVIVADMNPGLGGTGTYGGIHAYWFGYREGYARQVASLVNDLHDRTRHPRQQGDIPRWNIECKIHALLEAAHQAGVDLLLNALFIGTLAEGNQVRGAVAATRYGPVALRSQVTVDATGDGDVAAFAGAPYALGSARDHSLMYGYMAQIIQPGRPRNVKTRAVDITNVEDYTRGIMAERRTREPGDIDHGIYFAPRESRHMQADVTLTLSDQLVRRAFPDAVLLAFSNNDIKGQSTSDWVLMGLQSPHLDVEIPYRALLPVGLDNVIVAGKAFSATHDALAAPRMQPDMENLGGIAALAAAMSIQRGVRPRELPVRALQERLAAAGALPARILARELEPLSFTTAELDRKMARIDPDAPLHRWSRMRNNRRYDGRVDLADVMCAGPHVVPYLEARFARADGRMALLLAQALAVLGSRQGVDLLVKACLADLQGDRLPMQDDVILYKGIPPDQNAAADVAFLIYSLGLARDRRALPVWARVIALMARETPADVMDKKRSAYYYVTAVCYGIERLADPACVALLRQLRRYAPFLRKQAAAPTALAVDYVDERLAYLELLIARCLARCGSPEGYLVLIDYLQDVRAVHAEHAHTELINVTGEDFGKDQALWSDWLERHGEALPCIPYAEAADPVKAWDERILIDPVHERAMA